MYVVHLSCQRFFHNAVLLQIYLVLRPKDRTPRNEIHRTITMEQFSGWEWFYLDDEAQNVGPFTTEELVEFYAAQGITDDTYGT